MISFHQVTKFYGKKDLFRDCNLTVRPTDRIGLVGPNGSGKTTLLRLIIGEETPDKGQVARQKGVQIGYLPQELLVFSEKRVLETVMDVAHGIRTIQGELERVARALEQAPSPSESLRLAEVQGRLQGEFERLGGYALRSRAEKILMGLGFRETDFQRSVGSLSGGWAMRVALARLLLMEPDLIHLHELTNHLHVDSLLWLEGYLTSFRSALIVVSHDRVFLNRVVRRIIEIDGGSLIPYSGNYDHFLTEKRKRISLQWAAYCNQQEQIRQIERFIERNRVRKDRAKQVQSRLKALERMEKIEPPEETEGIHFEFLEPPPAGKVLLSLKGISKSFRENRVYERISLELYRGDRLAFIGPNGAGKSTLMRIMAGVLAPDEGIRQVGTGTRIAYFSQGQVDQLHAQGTVLEEVQRVAGNRPVGWIRGLLGAFLFKGEEVFKRVEVLSGGEKSRLLLCKVLLQEANLLLMDEPSNHLDVQSCEILREALMAYPGTLCLITHDRHLIDAVANKILVVRDGTIELFPGNYEDYERIWKRRLEGDPEAGRGGIPGKVSEEGRVEEEAVPKGKKTKERKRVEAERRNRLYRERAPLLSRLREIEEEVDRAQRRLQEIQTLMGDRESYGDPQRIRGLVEEHARVKAELERWTKEWEEKAHALEMVEATFDHSMAFSSSSSRPK